MLIFAFIKLSKNTYKFLLHFAFNALINLFRFVFDILDHAPCNRNKASFNKTALFRDTGTKLQESLN